MSFLIAANQTKSTEVIWVIYFGMNFGQEFLINPFMYIGVQFFIMKFGVKIVKSQVNEGIQTIKEKNFRSFAKVAPLKQAKFELSSDVGHEDLDPSNVKDKNYENVDPNE